MNRLSIHDISINLSGAAILSGISLDVPVGQCICITGSSGVGKTTLLKAIVGIFKTTTGTINKHNSKLSYLFQEHRLLPWCTAYQNIALCKKSRNNLTIADLMNKLDLREIDGFKYPNELSGGMRQRVALARALINNPDLLLMDEPFSSLDFPLRIRMQNTIVDLMKETQLSVLLVSHDREEVLRLADKVIRLDGHPATISQTLAITEPKENRSYDFIRSHVEHHIFTGIS